MAISVLCCHPGFLMPDKVAASFSSRINGSLDEDAESWGKDIFITHSVSWTPHSQCLKEVRLWFKSQLQNAFFWCTTCSFVLSFRHLWNHGHPSNKKKKIQETSMKPEHSSLLNQCLPPGQNAKALHRNELCRHSLSPYPVKLHIRCGTEQ